MKIDENYVNNIFGKICVAFFKLFPIRKNRIYFMSNYGERYSCNPRAFFEYLYNNHKDEFEFYYCLNKKCGQFPEGVKHHRFFSFLDLYYLYTSKYVVSNVRFHLFFAKRKNQIYIQTWHGGPIMYKKFEKDASNLPYIYKKMAINDSQYIDILCCGSKQAKNVLDSNFYCDGKTFMTGNPRCDKLVNQNLNEKKKIREGLGLNESDYVVLYAPTFRNNQKVEDSVMDNLSLKRAFENAIEGKKIKILYRFHPNVARKSRKLKLEEFVKNVTFYPDIQDLILVADLLVTDFSSCMFDMMLAGKPCIIFTNDSQKYISQERGVYFSAKERMPLPIVNSEKELIDVVRKIGTVFENYSQKLREFFDEFGCIEDGKASERLYHCMKEVKK